MTTVEAKRVKELALGKRKLEPEDLAMFGVGAAVATIAPSPTDLVYFYVERWLDDHRNEISPTRYWALRAANYYFTDSAFHIALLAWILISHRPVSEKAEMYFSLVAAGATVAVLFDFIRDEEKKRKNGGAVKVFSAPGSIRDFEVIL